MKKNLAEKVFEFIEGYGLVKKDDSVLIALSGGADSVCLFYLLYEYAKKEGINLSAIHVNHGIRGKEALRDEEFVRTLCREHNVPCYVSHVSVPQYVKENKVSSEEAGRILRYKELNEVAEKIGATKIALAHHADDVAETMIFFLCRGTSMAGLTPIKPLEGKFIRPLLDVTRKDIREYLGRRDITFCEDSTNEDDELTRNYIRHEIIPRLSKVNNKAIHHLVKTAGLIGDAYDVVKKVSDDCYDKAVIKDDYGIKLMIDNLPKEQYLRSEIALRVLGEIAGSRKDIMTVHVEDLLSLIDKQVGRSICLPYGMTARRDYDSIRIKANDPTKEVNDGDFEERIEDILETRVFLYEKGMSIPEKPYTKWFSYDIIRDTYSIRRWNEDDYIVFDAKGHTKKVKELLKNEKVPKEQRDKVMVLFDKENFNHVYWVIGVRMGEDAKVTDMTREVIEVTILSQLLYD